MRILRAGDHRRMPWKNGSGETIEIAVSPPGAGVDDFDWRVSMARVERSGPFSRFDGVDRAIAILDGERIELAVQDRPSARLTPASPPYDFEGDKATAARLLGGPVTDLNLMARRGRFAGRIEPLFAAVEHALAGTPAGASVVLVARGSALATQPEGATLALARHDAVMLEGSDERISVSGSAGSRLFLIEIVSAGEGGPAASTFLPVAGARVRL